MNDDTLILYYYNDGLSEREREEVGAALERDKTLAGRYDALCRELDGVVDDTLTPASARAVNRWRASIDRVARPERSEARRGGAPFHIPSFAWGAAITAALVIGVGIGVFISGEQNSAMVDGALTAADTGEYPPGAERAAPDAFSRGLRVHLRESRRYIDGLATSADVERALLIMDIIEQNRLFERAADQNQAPELARVLRAFEPVLLRLAADDIAPEDAESLRAQLAFELNVMLTKLERGVSDESQSI